MSDQDECPETDTCENSDNFSDRGAPVRSTVARKCREFYLRRLERTETLQRRWSVSTSGLADLKTPEVDGDDSSSGVESEGSCSGQETRRRETVKRVTDHSQSAKDDARPNQRLDRSDSDASTGSSSDTQKDMTGSALPTVPPLRKWNSTLDLAMDNLRREITSLINQDNDLFRQLLSLNDSIAELRHQQKKNLELSQLEDDDFDDEYDGSRSPSLESLSDPDTSATTPSPASTLSSSCSSHYSPNNINGSGISRRPALPSSMRKGSFHRHNHPRSSVSNLCLRCHSSSGKLTMPLLRRRAHSQASLHSKRDDFDSYDSGIHLQGAHSDSDHEIFV